MTDRLTCEQVQDRELIERYVAGSLGEADADALEAHALECDACWAEMQRGVALRSALVGEPAAVEAPASASHTVRSRITALAAAAVVLLAIGATWRWAHTRASEAPVLRGADGQIAVAARWQPDGSLRVTWAASPGASSYRVELSGPGTEPSVQVLTGTELSLAANDARRIAVSRVEVEAENPAGEVIGRGALDPVPRP